ncbi:MAG: hypothetical protein IIC55_08455, partial [Proteobacteria bacterium]|nr:hypothetical protein [Pseudomonadota bacterium]
MRRGLDYLDEDTWGTVFRDVILLALIGFVAMVIMLLPHITPKKQEAEDHEAPGNVIIEIHWPNNMPYDVDLWVQAPREVPVGFWNMGGTTFNLLRDDLGGEGDATDKNYEITYSRGIPAGEYIVNVHMYGPLPQGVTIPVNVVVSVKPMYADLYQILETIIKLTRRNQEETAYRFRLTAEGELVPGTFSTLNRPLITGFK